MKTFQQYLLSKDEIIFRFIPSGHEFQAEAHKQLRKLESYRSEWKELAKAQFSWNPQHARAQRSYASLGAMAASTPSVRSFKAHKNYWMDRLGEAQESVREKEVVPGRIGDTQFADSGMQAVRQTKVISDALQRYHGAAGPRSKSVDKDLLGSLIVDIYTATGLLIRRIHRSHDRTNFDCILFQLYRSVNIAAADAFEKLFKNQHIEGYIRQQSIAMSHHGFELDETLFKDTQKNVKYFTDAKALGFRLEFRAGKIYQRDMSEPDKYKLADTTSDDHKEGNPCWSPGLHLGHAASRDGVTGYAMLSNREIYATMHTADPIAGSVYHSAYAAGKEILCSGTLSIKQGVLTYIDNGSGHYKPSTSQVALCIQSLRASGINIKNLTVFTIGRCPRGTEDVRYISGEAFLDRYARGALAVNAEGRYLVTARRIRQAIHKYEGRHKGIFAGLRHQSDATREALRRLNFIMETGDDEALVRTAAVLVGRTHEFQETNEHGHLQEPKQVPVPAPDVRDDRGAQFAKLAPLPDRRDKWLSKDRGPGGLKKLLIEAMKDYNPV